MNKMTVKLGYQQKLSLVDMAISMQSFCDVFQIFCKTQAHEIKDGEEILYLESIEQGSLIFNLSNNFEGILPFLADANIIFCFIKYLNEIKNYFLFKNADTQKPYHSEKELNKFKSTIEAVINNSGYLEVNSLNLSFSVNCSEAERINKEIKNEINALKEKTEKIYSKKLFYWNQARFDKQLSSGYKGIIENIYDKPLRVIFDRMEDKVSMTENSQFKTDWHKLGYIVDVEVMSVENKPCLYKILKCYRDETFEMDEKSSLFLVS